MLNCTVRADGSKKSFDGNAANSFVDITITLGGVRFNHILNDFQSFSTSKSLPTSSKITNSEESNCTKCNDRFSSSEE